MIQFLFELVLNKCIECQSLVMKIAFKYFRGFFCSFCKCIIQKQLSPYQQVFRH